LIVSIIPENPDHRVLNKAVEFLQQDKVLAIPTDTNWAYAVDLFSKAGMQKLYTLKNYARAKHFSLLCQDISQASKYAIISDQAYRRIHKLLPGPYTFIFPPKNSLPRTIRDYRKDQQIGVRIPASKICLALAERLDHPLILTTIPPTQILDLSEEEVAELSSDEKGGAAALAFNAYQIEEALHHQVDLILDPGEVDFGGSSTVVDFSQEPARIVRQGQGKIDQILGIF
jgi:tRNA threonylcarbamoyl adenosine modification protein (Sua5/YciO/YrdC/YwlC family)